MKLSTPALLAMGLTSVAAAIAMEAIEISGVSLYLGENPFEKLRASEFVGIAASHSVTIGLLSVGVLCAIGAMLNWVLTKRHPEE